MTLNRYACLESSRFGEINIDADQPDPGPSAGISTIVSEKITFHFEGGLADDHKLNFYEAARFQYAAARLLVKLAQFRKNGRFQKRITPVANFDIQLSANSAGSFNVNIEDNSARDHSSDALNAPLSDLIAFVGERVIRKIDNEEISSVAAPLQRAFGVESASDAVSNLEKLATAAISNKALLDDLPDQVQELVKRRIAESYRENILQNSRDTISLIDPSKAQKLIGMSAPLIREMATALRRSANTLEVRSHLETETRPILFLDRDMAEEIEVAAVDTEITSILGDIIQFNKDNGWGKIRTLNRDNVSEVISFSIPVDLLPSMKGTLIKNMQRDQVYLQTYKIKDRSGSVIRLLAVGVLLTPPS